MSSEARELELFIENNSQLYNSQEKPIQKNLITKMARGIYSHSKAVKLYGYLMENGAKEYARVFGGVWHQMFSTSVRKEAAESFAKSFETEAKLGNYDYMLPKKYQGWSGGQGQVGNRRRNPSLSGMVADVKQLPRDIWTDAKVMVTRAGKIVAKIPAKAMRMTGGGRRRNPGTEDNGQYLLDLAYQAGRQWRQHGAATSGVANARVVRYGFIKWWNNNITTGPLPYTSVGSSRRVTKKMLEKTFREGYKLGKY